MRRPVIPSAAADAPWAVPLTDAEHQLILYALGVAAFALGAMALRQGVLARDVGDRYRPVATTGLMVVTVAFVSYLGLVAAFLLGYTRRGDVWVPNDGAVLTWSIRYMDWSVSVPLLVVEIIAASAVVGGAAVRLRRIGVAAAFGMIATGYLGAVVMSGGDDRTTLLVWGLVSSACFLVLYIVIITVVMRSLPVLPAAARGLFRTSMLLLVVTWFVYPVLYGLQGLVSGGEWTTVAHVAFAITDVTAKVGFGLLLWRVARIRTAADVVGGEDRHGESIWIDQVRLASGDHDASGR